MTININGASVDTGSPVQVPRAATPVISAAGVNDAATLARQQLPTAVPAPTLIAAYSTATPPPPKPPTKPTISSPSSALAAQFIAQDASVTEEELAIFIAQAPSTPASGEPESDDYLSALRAARGDVPPTKAIITKPLNAATPQQPSSLLTAGAESPARGSIAQFASALPSLISQLIRKPSIASARGFSAYQLAEARNATIRNPVQAEATS